MTINHNVKKGWNGAISDLDMIRSIVNVIVTICHSHRHPTVYILLFLWTSPLPLTSCGAFTRISFLEVIAHDIVTSH